MKFSCSGLDLFAYKSDSKSLHLVESKKLNVSWYAYTHESRLVLMASGMQCKTFHGFQVQILNTRINSPKSVQVCNYYNHCSLTAYILIKLNVIIDIYMF